MTTPALTPDDTMALIRERWRVRLSSYAEHASRGDWLPYRFAQHLADEIQRRVIPGGARVIINCPPRHGKSQIVTRRLPAWFLEWFPRRRVIISTYGQDLSTDFSRQIRNDLRTFDETWVNISPDSTAANRWDTTSGGGLRAVGVGGPITGRGGDLLIVDDPVKNMADAQSETHRRSVIDWFNSTLLTRAEPGASVVIIMTRWHQSDLTGYLLREHGADWQTIILPAVAEADDPMGREIGEALCPERFPLDELERIKTAVGARVWTGLYQQRPAPPGGALIRREWIRHWDRLPEDVGQYITAWDMNFKATTDGSYCVGQAWAKAGADCYLLDQYRERVDFVTAKRAVEAMAEKWPGGQVLVEDAANGPAIISSLKSKVPNIIPVKPTGSKEARLSAVAPMFEAGNVLFPHPASAAWVGELVEELVNFPAGVHHDDQVDALSHALGRYIAKPRLALF